MRIARRSATTALLGAAAGALLSAALLNGPVAYADDTASIPDSPYTPVYFNLPGTSAGLSNLEGSDNGLYQTSSYDNAFTTSAGSYEVHVAQTEYFSSFPVYGDTSQTVTLSDGIAPAVGTTWNGSSFIIPFGGDTGFEVFQNQSLTTPDGMVDELSTQFNLTNVFYEGPGGTADYLEYVAGPGATHEYFTLFDIPAAGDTAAAINPADLVGLADAHSLATLAADIPSLF
jgi:hypothetical protein